MSDSISKADASRSWRRELAIGVLILMTITGAHWVVGWYNGRGLRPFALAGFVFWIMTAFASGARRRWIKAHRPELTLKPWRFSFLELLVLVTGLTLFLGFTIADHHETARVLREHSAFRSSVETLLGVDGRIDFDVDGSLMISICDRSFDDARLVKLAEKIDDWNPNVGVSRIIFGTGMKTNEDCRYAASLAGGDGPQRRLDVGVGRVGMAFVVWNGDQRRWAGAVVDVAAAE